MKRDLKQYYDILGLPEFASVTEIKKRYRELAKLYHPDVNQEETERFLLVKEAYNTLINSKLISKENSLNDSIYYNSKRKNATSAERMKKAYRQKKVQEYRDLIANEQYYQNIINSWKWKVVNTSAIVGMLLSLIIVIDFLLPRIFQNDEIISCELGVYNGLSFDVSYVRKIHLASNQSFFVEESIINNLGNNQVFLVKTSWMKNEMGIVPMYNSKGFLNDIDFYQLHEIQFTFGTHSLMIIPILLIPIFVVCFKRKSFWFTLFYYLSFYLSTPLIFVYLLSNNRLLNILMLG